MWWTAILMGLAGSLHCAGMCSPLVMAVTPPSRAGLIHRLHYNAGRVLIYGILGAAVAGAGLMLPLHQYQNAVSIGLGVALLVIGMSGVRNVRIRFLHTAIGSVTNFIKRAFGRLLQKKSARTVFILGALNGLLPCGLTLIALTTCLTLRGPLDGFNFMVLFGVGTLPVMLGLAGSLSLVARKLNWSIQRLTTSMLILSGCILILRVFLVHGPHVAEEGNGWADIILCQ